MPSLSRVGVSRKIEDEDDRKRLKRCLLIPASAQGTRLHRPHCRRRTAKRPNSNATWNTCCDSGKRSRGESRSTTEPGVIYEESDLIIRTIRDIYSDDIDQILVDEPESYREGSRLSPYGDAASRRSSETVRQQLAAVSQVQVGEGNHQDQSAPGPASRGRIDRHRSHRSLGGDRCQQRQLSWRTIRPKRTHFA